MAANGILLKKRWRAGEVSLGLFVHCTDPAFANILSYLGFDFLILDNEHQPFNQESMQNILLNIRASDTVPMVRVAENSVPLIKHALDFGAEGILVPMVRTADEACRAVAAIKYPPMGERGMGGRAVTDFYRKNKEYVETANDRTIVMLQMEHIDAVNHIEEIAQVPGVDCLFVGQVDLSASMGLAWQIEHPDVQAATQRVLDVAKTHHIAVGVGLDASPEVVLAWAERGARVMALGMDWSLMRRQAEDMLSAIRGALAAREAS